MRPPLDSGVAPDLGSTASEGAAAAEVTMGAKRFPSPAGADLSDSAAGELLRRFHLLPDSRLALLRAAAEVARACGSPLFWVGGGVRDLWLERNEIDIDLVLDGELWPFASRLAARLGGVLQTHPQFLTAELAAPGGVRIDLAQLRAERYSTPAALPTVEPGTLVSDLARRDFSINTLAIPLTPGLGERLIDFHGGLRDLSAGLLRALHPGSFRDDPTRILRGLEFESRFGFSWTEESRREAGRAIADGHVAALSPGRLGEALRRALGRPENAGRVLRRLGELGLLTSVDPGMEGAPGAAGLFDSSLAAYRDAAGTCVVASFPLALLCLALGVAGRCAERWAHRLALLSDERDLVTAGPERVREAVATLTSEALPSAVHSRLGPLAESELAVVAAHGEVARAWVERELAELRSLRLRISGRELLAAGIAAGPALGRALDLTLGARLDGRLDADEELEFALRAASSRGGGEGI